MNRPISDWADVPLPRVIRAFIIVPALSAAGYAIAVPPVPETAQTLGSLVSSTILYAALGSYPLELLFGVPSFFLLRRYIRPRLIYCMLAGALVAGVPLLVHQLQPLPDVGVSVNDGPPVWYKNVRSTAQLIDSGHFVAGVSAAGAFAGALFWMITVALKQSSEADL